MLEKADAPGARAPARSRRRKVGAAAELMAPAVPLPRFGEDPVSMRKGVRVRVLKNRFNL
ncbi:MAG: hypothetical protein AB1774_02650 [Bacillota bacterium]